MKRTCARYQARLITALIAGVLMTSTISSALAQPSLSVSVGGNAPFAFSTYHEEELFRDLWSVGFNIGVMAQVPVSRWVLLDPTLTYRIYPYQEFHQETFIGSTRLLSSSGEPMQQLFVGLGVRFQDPTPTNAIAAFAELNAGYEVERDGKVRLQWQEQGGSEYTTESTPEERDEWAYSVGVGVLARLSSHFSLQPAFHWHGSGKDRNYVLVTVDLVYALPL